MLYISLHIASATYKLLVLGACSLPLSQAWKPCISDVRSIREMKITPKSMPFRIRIKAEKSPRIMLYKKKKYDMMENSRLKERERNQKYGVHDTG